MTFVCLSEIIIVCLFFRQLTIEKVQLFAYCIFTISCDLYAGIE